MRCQQIRAARRILAGFVEKGAVVVSGATNRRTCALKDITAPVSTEREFAARMNAVYLSMHEGRASERELIED